MRGDEEEQKGKMGLPTKRGKQNQIRARASRQGIISAFRSCRIKSRNPLTHNASRAKSCSVVGGCHPRPERRVALGLSRSFPPEGTLCLVLGVSLELGALGIWSFQPTFGTHSSPFKAVRGVYTTRNPNPKPRNQSNDAIVILNS